MTYSTGRDRINTLLGELGALAVGPNSPRPSVSTHSVDFGSAEDIRQLFAEISSLHGGKDGPDILVSNAGYGKRIPDIADIPIHDEKVFGDWLLQRWREKDDLIEHYLDNGRFPADEGTSPASDDGSAEPLKGAGYIETEVKPTNPFEFLQIFAPVAAFALLVNVVLKLGGLVLRVLRIR